MNALKLNVLPRNLAWASASLILLIVICSCSKPKVVECNSTEIINNLIKNIKAENPTSTSYLNIEVESIHSENSPYTLICHGTVSLKHTLFPEFHFKDEYTFEINKKQKQLADIEHVPNNISEYSNWLDKLPTIISLQKTQNGNLIIIQKTRQSNINSKNQIQQLYFDQQEIKLNGGSNYSTITIDKKFSMPNREVFLISTYYNSPKDQSINHHYLIGINRSGPIEISDSFSYQDGSIEHKDPNILTLKGINKLPFAESDDYPIYSYESAELIQTKSVKPDSYYHKKFASLSAKEILHEVKTDGCLNGDQFYLSEICDNKISTYCFKFNSMVKPRKDKAFWLLNNMCHINSYN